MQWYLKETPIFMVVWSYIEEVLYCFHDERSAKMSFVSGTAVKQNHCFEVLAAEENQVNQITIIFICMRL